MTPPDQDIPYHRLVAAGVHLGRFREIVKGVASKLMPLSCLSLLNALGISDLVITASGNINRGKVSRGPMSKAGGSKAALLGGKSDDEDNDDEEDMDHDEDNDDEEDKDDDTDMDDSTSDIDASLSASPSRPSPVPANSSKIPAPTASASVMITSTPAPTPTPIATSITTPAPVPSTLSGSVLKPSVEPLSIPAPASTIPASALASDPNVGADKLFRQWLPCPDCLARVCVCCRWRRQVCDCRTRDFLAGMYLLATAKQCLFFLCDEHLPLLASQLYLVDVSPAELRQRID